MELVGEQVGPYRVGESLGSGGMGCVYRATDDDGHIVAIKALHPHLLATRGAFKRFLREARLGREIAHPNVVRTLDADALLVRDRQVHYLVLEYVEGQTLDGLLAELGSVPEELCRHIGRQVADALSAIHAMGAVHRDLKPANIIITPDHEVKVMDLGVALLMEEAMRLSDPGDFLGSVLYAAPEQWNPGATLDGRVDLFALGVVLYELATGRHPFAANRKAMPLSMMNSCRAEPASATHPELSAFFVELIAKLIEPDAEERFASAQLTYGILDAGERSHWWERRHVELDRAGQTRDRRIQVPRDSGVFGRTRELELLAEAMEAVRAGEGRVVLLEGESGIGKTRLVDEFLRREQEPLQFLFGSYPPGGANPAQGALSTAFREHFGSTDLESKLQSALPDMAGLVPGFAALLRGEAPPDEQGALSVESAATAFAETTRSLADSGPVILFLDDLHFAPTEAATLFARIAHAIPDQPVLLIGAYRPRTADAWSAELTTLRHVSRIELQRLTPADLSELLNDALGSVALADQLGWEIARKSDGNPFFVFEILRDLRERKQLVRTDEGTWKTTGLIRQIDTPHSVRDLIHARLKKLDDEDRDLLDVAACCGYRFDPAIVAAATGMDLVPALKRFRRLERDHSLIRPEGREYLFDHHQMQEAIYSDLFEQLRDQYHAALGEACERQWPEPTADQCVTLSMHFLKGGRPERTAPHLRRAVEHLHAGNLFESMTRIAGMALEAGEPKDPEERFAVLIAARTGANMTGDWEAESRFGEEMTAIATRLGDESKLCNSYLGQGNHLYAVSELEPAIEAYARAGELARKIGDETRLAGAERGIGVCMSRLGRDEESLQHHRRSLELYTRLDHRASLAAAHTNIGVQLVGLGRPDEAESHYEIATRLARETGQRRWEANVTANWGRVHFERGDYAQAWECAIRYRELVRLIGDRRGESASGVILCTLWMIFGALDEMEHELTHIETALAETRDRWMSGYALRQRAWIAEQRGDLENALRLYEEAAALRREVGDMNSLPHTLADLGAVQLRMGRTAEGVATLRETIAFEEATAETRANALCELAVVEPDRLAEARQALDATKSRGLLSVAGPHNLWRATGDEADLERAHAALLDLESRIPVEYRRASMQGVWRFAAVREAFEKRSR